jgi:hypothetical protein
LYTKQMYPENHFKKKVSKKKKKWTVDIFVVSKWKMKNKQ